MSLFAILSSSSQALGVHRARVNTASHNLANVATPGFSRRRVELGAVEGVPIRNGMLGGGVEILATTRARDTFLEAQVGRTYGAAARSETARDRLFSVRVFDVDAPGKISSAVTDFFAAMRALGQHPDQLATRQEALASVDALGRSFQTAARELDGARRAIDQDLAQVVPMVNEMTERIAVLNREIQTAIHTGRDPNDLMDERLLLAEKVSALTGATAIPDEKGNVNLFLGGEVPLVIADQFATLDTVGDPTNRGHLSVTITSSDGAGPRPLDASLTGGALGGLLDARDGAMRQALDDLDTLAFELAASLNATHAAGFGLDGVSGRNLVDAGPTVQGAAFAFARDPGMTDPAFLGASATAASTPGDGDNAFALAALEQVALPSGRAPADFAHGIVSAFGTAARRADALSQQDVALRDRLEGMRLEVSGVSTDEELIKMTEAQRAFEAVSKVIQTADTLLEAVISLK